MSNIIISELRPDESFLTELESDVLTTSIVGGYKDDYKYKGKRGKKGGKKVNIKVKNRTKNKFYINVKEKFFYPKFKFTFNFFGPVNIGLVKFA